MKRYFTKSAERKAKVLDYLNSISNTYILHLMCLKYFPGWYSENYWKGEIKSYFGTLPKLKGDKTLKYSQSYQNLWGRVEDSFIDRYEGWIHNLNHREITRIDYFDITEEEKKSVHDYIEKVTDWICTKLQSDGYVSPSELETILKGNKLTMSRLTEEIRSDKKVCCICGTEFYGYGNNPAPVKPEGHCCDKCNLTVVIPARIEKTKRGER